MLCPALREGRGFLFAKKCKYVRVFWCIICYMDKSDNKLIEEYLNGEDEAFAKLLKKHLSPVFNFLCRIVLDRETAEDLAQITFLKVWKNLHKFDFRRSRLVTRRDRQNKNLAPYRTGGSGSGFKTWLFAIAKNTAFDWLKKKKEVAFSAFVDEEGESRFDEIADENILPDEILERKNIAEELDIILQKLPLHYRAILLLHYKEEFTLQEIAEILDEPYNTIKSRHQRGLGKLKLLFPNQRD